MRSIILYFQWAALLAAVPAALTLTVGDPVQAQEVGDEELEDLLGAPGTTGGAATTAGGRGSTTVSGTSNTFNPAISVNGLVLGAGGENVSTRFTLQEFEIRFTSDIDAYFRADITIAFPGEDQGQGEENGEEKPPVEIEGAIISTTSIPNLTVEFGKFWLPFGKHNLLHTHQFPFISSPLVIEGTFGEEPLNELALQFTPLLPFSFFSEINLAVFQGDNETLFRFAEETDPETGESRPRGGPNKARYLVHSKNLFDLTDESTIEAGFSYLSGANNAGGGALTTVVGLDLTYKWKSQVGRGRSGVQVQLEWIESTRETPSDDLVSGGFYLSGQWRFAEFWWGQVRTGAFSQDTRDETGAPLTAESEHSDFLIAWVPTVFSAFRLQVSQIAVGEEDPETFYFVQYIFSIGSHPAHSY